DLGVVGCLGGGGQRLGGSLSGGGRAASGSRRVQQHVFNAQLTDDTDLRGILDEKTSAQEWVFIPFEGQFDIGTHIQAADGQLFLGQGWLLSGLPADGRVNGGNQFPPF